MGAGRKTETYTGSEEPHYCSGSGKFNSTARNLSKNSLAGVIFGCKYSTIRECHDKQLFGLPGPHISYVKNVYPGLTLFLFNYSDRKLHGVFEAASHGKLNIDPCAWTSDWTNADTTPYPAQVRFRVRFQCQPLLEEQFGPIIAENYYEQKLFWFELDHVQTDKLVSLFAPSPPRKAIPASLSAKTGDSGTQRTGKWSSLFKSSTGSSENKGPVTVASYSSCVNPVVTGGNRGLVTAANNEDEQKAESLVSSFGPSYSSAVRNVTSSSTINRNSMLTGKASSHASNEENFKRMSSEMTHGHPDSRGLEYTCKEVEDGKYSFGAIAQQNFCLAVEEPTQSRCQSSFHESKEYFTTGSNSNTDDMDWDSSSFQVHLDGLKRILEDPMEKYGLERYKEIPYLQNWNLGHCSSSMLPGWDNENDSWDIKGKNLNKSACGSSRFSAAAGDLIDDNGETKEKGFLDLCQQGAGVISEMGCSNFQAVVAQLVLEVNDLRLSQIKQGERMSDLEKELFESRTELQLLRGQSTSSEADEFQSTLESCPDLEETILLVGGSDGSSWLSTLDCYSLPKDKLELLCPMTSPRPYASVAMLRGEVYAIGGMHGGFAFGTVESYNREKNKWVGRPSLNHKIGNLASVSSNDKIFAIGGGDGFQPFHNVEMLDLGIGKWIPAQSMLQQRFNPAAAEINQVVYVVGGYDGTNYLKSAERYDPREVSWKRLESMNTKRRSHSLVVLHEKLYAIGGYNGNTMVPTVEVFDPRVGRWRTEESMNQARGCFGSVVMGDAIYVLGGIKDRDDHLDTVECYSEGFGWQLMDGKGIGKRSFFSAVTF